jgi:hypothetical protein
VEAPSGWMTPVTGVRAPVPDRRSAHPPGRQSVRADRGFIASESRRAPFVAERLRRARGLPKSIETVRGVYPRRDGLPHDPVLKPTRELRPYSVVRSGTA